MHRSIRRPSAAMAVACIALFLALSGTSVADVSQILPRNSVGTPQLRNSVVTSPKVRNGSLRIVDLAPAARRALAGQRGVAGPAGPQGPKGDKGDKGDPGPAGGAGISGLERVSASSPTNSVATKGVNVPCPAGKRVVGGGGAVIGGGADTALRSSAPHANGVEWNAAGGEANATAENWSVMAFALCAVVP